MKSLPRGRHRLRAVSASAMPYGAAGPEECQLRGEGSHRVVHVGVRSVTVNEPPAVSFARPIASEALPLERRVDERVRTEGAKLRRDVRLALADTARRLADGKERTD